MATTKPIVELQAPSSSVSHRGDDLVLHYDPFFLTRAESVSNLLPRSVIVQSLVDLLGNLPERDLCLFARSGISDELLAQLSLPYLDCSSPHQIILDLFRSMIRHFTSPADHWERACVIFGSTEKQWHSCNCYFLESLFKPILICHQRGSYMGE